jgi:hypothetical protein
MEKDRAIEKDMQRALREQSRSLGNFYKGIMTSLRQIEETMEKYAEERGGLTIEEAAAELELIKEIERNYVKLQMLRSRHDNWLQARKKVAQAQSLQATGLPPRPAPRPSAAPSPTPTSAPSAPQTPVAKVPTAPEPPKAPIPEKPVPVEEKPIPRGTPPFIISSPPPKPEDK